ncbi:Antirestriction protein [Hyella patelloides LEGE 07179]|uniref:Antirestriction protein n=1 Tax=Hyella patelloides LEGE 07179 TaxID=945734 RepID=A0A563W4U0_9CYAN|nr:antirestriction protein ArdA [Hyella patelloides]VEP18660.1 Antirestriction protein [Hyella patelloides LEGE 07179]
MTDEKISIFVADLAAYNNGILHGIWIDATIGEDGIREEIQAMLEASPLEDGRAEEYSIHDYEGFGSLCIHEYESIAQVAAWAHFLEEHGAALGSAVLAYYDDIDEAQTALEDRYCGEFESVTEYAENLITDCYEIPAYLEGYIDYEKWGRDIELGGDIITFELGFREVHIFHSY